MSDEKCPKCEWCGKNLDVYHLPVRAECLQNLLTAANTENEHLRERVEAAFDEGWYAGFEEAARSADHEVYVDGRVHKRDWLDSDARTALFPEPAKDDGAGVVFDTEEGDR